MANQVRKRSRPKRTWMRIVRIDQKRWNLPRDFAQDQWKWRNRVHVADPTQSDKDFMMTKDLGSFYFLGSFLFSRAKRR